MPASSPITSLTFHVARTGNLALVQCRGRLVADACEEFHSQIRALIPECKRIVIDFADLALVDSMGMGVLVRLHVSATAAGSCIELVNLGEQVRHVLGITDLLTLFGDSCEKDLAAKL